MADRYIGAQLRTMEPRGDTVSREVSREEVGLRSLPSAPSSPPRPSCDRTFRRESVNEQECCIYSRCMHGGYL
jgi:hypothetical protein